MSGGPRGWIRIGVTSAVVPDNLTGDFFSVDVDGAFASGERLLAGIDLCQFYEIGSWTSPNGGLLAPTSLTGFLRGFLVGIAPVNTLTFAALALLLVLASAAGCLMPAPRPPGSTSSERASGLLHSTIGDPERL